MTDGVTAQINDLQAEIGALRGIVILLAARELFDREPDHVAKFGRKLRESIASSRLPDGSGPVELEDLEITRLAVLERLDEMLGQVSQAIGKQV